MSEWKSFKHATPTEGKFYDITNDDPYNEGICNVLHNMKYLEGSLREKTAVFVTENFDKYEVGYKHSDWWFKEIKSELVDTFLGIKKDREELEKVMTPDPVYKPRHYKTDVGFECIDMIRLTLTKEQFKGFLLGNAMKYIWRHKLKGKSEEDLQKAKWYLDYYENFVGYDEENDKSYGKFVFLRECIGVF